MLVGVRTTSNLQKLILALLTLIRCWCAASWARDNLSCVCWAWSVWYCFLRFWLPLLGWEFSCSRQWMEWGEEAIDNEGEGDCGSAPRVVGVEANQVCFSTFAPNFFFFFFFLVETLRVSTEWVGGDGIWGSPWRGLWFVLVGRGSGLLRMGLQGRLLLERKGVIGGICWWMTGYWEVLWWFGNGLWIRGSLDTTDSALRWRRWRWISACCNGDWITMVAEDDVESKMVASRIIQNSDSRRRCMY